MPDRHAWIGYQASSFERHGVCTPSARLEEQFPETTSIFAEEGTRAHDLAEKKLTAMLNKTQVLHLDDYDDEMWGCTDDYRDFVEEELNAARAITPDAKLFVELQVEFSEYLPEGFGTSDAVIVSDETLEVIDLKYGRGVPVDAVGNAQLRLYALGSYLALSPIYDFTKVKMCIFQPRLHSLTTDTMSVEDLLDWGENYVKPRAELIFKGEGEFVVGEHCRFCRAGSVCRARAAVAFSVIDTAEATPDSKLLKDEEIEAVLGKLDATEDWISSIRTYAEAKALSGEVKWKGYKLVESRTTRKITDQLEALRRLESNGFDRDDVTTLKLKGLTELERIVSKKRFNELIGDLIEKPQGQPTLVKESDKRPEINPIENAFKEN